MAQAKYRHTGSVHSFEKVPEPNGGGFWGGLALLMLFFLLLSQCGH